MNAGNSTLPVCTMFDARKGEVYTATYIVDGCMKLISPEKAASPLSAIENIVEPTLFIGDGAIRYHELLSGHLGACAVFPDEDLNKPKASAGVPLAIDLFNAGEAVSPFELQPRYLRLSEAELNKTRAV
jgi:tRNA threonylcarbamoyladenosine biosynthesis protein TsaB